MTPTGSPAIVVAGDALVDLTPATTEQGATGYVPRPGGSCLNVAVGLGRLGVPTAFLARISRDAFGQLLRDHLAASDVRPDYLIDTDDLTTLAAVHLRDGQASYSFHAAEAADRGLRPEHLPELPAGAALHLGSIALVLEPVASTLEGLLLGEAGRRFVSLDPNIRPGLIADREVYRRRFATWVEAVDLLKVSDEDLAWLAGGRAPEDVVADWLAGGIAMVLVTHGADGASAWTSAASARVPAPPVALVDTVGAGDAFMSGALAHLIEQGQLSRQAARELDARALIRLLTAACRIAADTCTRAGAEPPRLAALTSSQPPAAAVAVRLGVPDLVNRARELAGSGRRSLLGITGAPGAGKSTVARAIVDALGPDLAVLVPMDGFHLSNRTLLAWDRRGRKGAWDTFDADGYVHLLRRLRHPEEPFVHAPDFDRTVDESIGSALPVPRGVPLVITEGNYLLSDRGAWTGVAPLLDESWYLEVADDIRHERLDRRHQLFGMPPEQAAAWARGTDQDNAAVVAASRARADLVVTVVTP